MRYNTIINAAVLLLMITTGSLFLSSCQSNLIDDLNNQGNTGAIFDNSERTTATFIGQILKEDGTPLDGAMVSTGTNQIITDADGFFYFSNISTPLNATLIKVQKLGYFNAYRTFKVIPNQDNQTTIMIMELPQAEILNASTGGTITIANGGSIEFPANAIVDKFTNQAYTGNVNVFAKWIDPSSDELAMLLPGDLRGINSEYGEEGLTTYGMQAVELFGDNGQPLQLGNGAKAKVKFPLPSSLQGTAPATVPLWHFDELQGMWVEDGVAQKSGNEYIGQVSHFSFWNCDYGGPVAIFTCALVDNNNIPINGAIVRIVRQSVSTDIRFSYSNSNGSVSGGVPINETFNLEYIPSGCDYNSQPIFIQSFTSGTTSINLGNIVVSNTTSPAVVTGTTTDCNAQTLPNAPVKIKIGTKIYSVLSDPNGQFSLNINCLAGAVSSDITAFDVNNSVNGSVTSLINPSVTNNVGAVQACGTQNDYISCTGMNGATAINYNITAPSGTFSQSFQTPYTSIYAYDGNLFSAFGFDGAQSLSGTHNLYSYADGNDSATTITPSIVNLTKYENVGGKIEGSFSTTVNGSLYSGATINCNFRVTRQQ